MGWVDEKDSSIIHWQVRIDFAKKTIQNAIYNDTIGPNQKLVSGSVTVEKGHYDGGNFKSDGLYENSTTTENGTTGFSVSLGTLSSMILISYTTEATDGGASAQYTNSGKLTGDQFETETTTVETSVNGGGGSADTTVSISGTKTWEDHQNQDGKRPNSITVELKANGQVVQTKQVTAADQWKYSFTNLAKYDDGKLITYSIDEVAVPGYTTEVNGTNLINTSIAPIVPVVPTNPTTPVNPVKPEEPVSPTLPVNPTVPNVVTPESSTSEKLPQTGMK